MCDSEHDYALFRGEVHYPLGGWNDFYRSYGDNLEQARADGHAWSQRSELEYNWWFHIVDLKTGEIIEEARWPYSLEIT